MTVFCRGCGKEIHETAPICPHCGAPQRVFVNENKSISGAGRVLAIFSLLFFIGSVIFIVYGVFDIFSMLDGIGAVGQISIDKVSGPVEGALTGISLGVGFGLVGGIVAIIALFGYHFSAKWYVWMLLVLFPIGTIVGIIFLVFGSPNLVTQKDNINR